MKTLVFMVSNWKFAIENKLVSQVINIGDTDNYPINNASFEIEYLNSKIKVFDFAKKMSLPNVQKAEKVILLELKNEKFGVLVNKILGIKDLVFEKLPTYLILKGKPKPLEGLIENSNEVISLLNNKILENIMKENL